MEGGQPERGDMAVTAETLQCHDRSGQVRQEMTESGAFRMLPYLSELRVKYHQFLWNGDKNGLPQHSVLRQRIEKLCLPIPLFFVPIFDPPSLLT